MLAQESVMHHFLTTWFHWVEVGGYFGVFTLMLLESTIIPLPSEIVIPPAAFWASQGRMNFFGVVFAGALGSLVGSLLMYWFAQKGAKFAENYPLWRNLHQAQSKFVASPKGLFIQGWVDRFGIFGVFIARMLPVVRHFISIPCGVLKMNLLHFSLATLAGSAVWCWILAWFGAQVIGATPELLHSPEMLMLALKAKLVWWVVGSVAFLSLTLLMHGLIRVKKYP